MSRCPICNAEMFGAANDAESCPTCGAAIDATRQTLIAAAPQRASAHLMRGGDEADPASVPSLLGQQPTSPVPLEPAQHTDAAADDLPKAVDFGPASAAWPGESDNAPPRQATFAPESLRTMQSGAFNVDAATHADERPLRTLDSGALPMSPEAILALWGGAHEQSTEPQTTIRPSGELTGGPRDSRLIISSRSIQPTQSPRRASAEYELLQTIGEGGVGVVYAARQASIDRTVAVKMLKPANAQKPEQREKFLSEAVVTGDLDHPNIVPIYDLGTNEAGALFYSMKRVHGTPWAKVLTEKPLPENLEILLKVADAIGFAHSRGIVHRDLKPENVMLGDYGEVLVMDWGLALVTPEFRKARTIAPATSMGGTPAYMAPEMATGPVSRVTRASDIYLLGALLYEIVTCQPPHGGKTVNACLLAAARNRIEPTEKRGELLDIALKAMATDPADRYGSVRDFQSAVRQYQAHSESIALSTRAERDLAEAQKSEDYERFSRALFGFQEAFALWSANERARDGISEAKLAYAGTAAAKGDFDLAMSLLDANDPWHAAQIESVAAARRERALRQQRLKNAKRIAKVLAAAMLLIVSGALVWVSHLYGVAEHEAEIANEQKIEANIARHQAETATGRAIQKTKEAQERRAEAERAKSEEEYAAYIAKIGLSAVKVEENAFGEVDRLLEECPPRLRNWEWGRLKFLCGRSLRDYPMHAPQEAVAFDSTARRFVTAGGDGKVRVWSVDNDREPLVEFDFGDPSVCCAAFSPDGRHVAAGGHANDNRHVKIWSLETGELAAALIGHTEQVVSITYNGDGTRLLTASYDTTARLWNAQTAECLREFQGHTWWVWSAAFSPAEDAIVTAGQDRKCIVWPLDGQGQEKSEDLRIFTGHTGPVYAAAFSPDGKYVVSGGYDGSVLVWHRDEAKPFSFESLSRAVKAPAPICRTLAGHTAAVRAIRFAHGGATRILTAAHDNTIKIWDYGTGNLIQTLRGHAGWIRGCDVSADGQLAVSASHDHTAKLWSLGGYQEVRVLNARVLSGHADGIQSARFSRGGEQVLTASRDRTARIWSVADGSVLKSFAEGHEFLASQAIVFRDGRRFLTSGIDSTVRIWDIATGTETRALRGTGASALVALSADERWLLSANGAAALLWDVETGQLVRRLADHRGEVTAIAFSPDGQLVVTGDATGRTRLWDRASGRILWNQRAHSASVNGAVFTPEGTRVLTASSDNTVGQFDTATGHDFIHETLQHGVPVVAIAIAPDGKRVITNAKDAKIRVWNLQERRVERTLAGLLHRASSFSLSADGRQLVTVAPLPLGDQASTAGGQTSLVQFWNLENGEEISDRRIETRMTWSAAFAPAQQVLLVGGDRASLYDLDGGKQVMSFSPHGAVTRAEYSPDERRIVTSGGDASAKVWDIVNGKAIFKLALEHKGPINSAVYSPDGDYILTASSDSTARLWHASTGELIHTYTGHTAAVRSAAFSADGMYVLTASSDGTVRLWTIGGKVVHVLRGHKGAVTCAVFSDDGNYIASGGEDNTARVWDACAGEVAGELKGHTAAVTSACFSPDGLRIVTGSQDSTAKLWDAQTAKEILTLKAHSEEVTSVDFSDDGRYVVTGSRDATAIVWLTDEWRTQAQGSAPYALGAK